MAGLVGVGRGREVGCARRKAVWRTGRGMEGAWGCRKERKECHCTDRLKREGEEERGG